MKSDSERRYQKHTYIEYFCSVAQLKMTQQQVLKSPRIIHLSSAHHDRDVRIFLKECRSLVTLFPNHEIHLVLAGVEARIEDGVHIHNAGPRVNSRRKRMTTTVNQVLQKALELDGVCYHLHDPELLRIAFKLKRNGKKVIYDAHEDLPRQFMGNSTVPGRKIISWGVEFIEDFIAARLDGIITATPYIAERFKRKHPNTIDVNNFPLANEIEFIENQQTQKEPFVCYIGGIWPSRGIAELVAALEHTQIELALAGQIEPEFKAKLTQLKGWSKVRELGFIDRQTSMQLKQQAIAGVVTFLPLPNHINAQPNKIFEYMAAGLPVIGANFPLWKALIEANYCGICVDPENPTEIAKAIQFLAENPEKAKEMGENGRKMVQNTYNWPAEEKKLLAFYQKVLAS
ncbi:MAG: hypothetical protein RLZZ65_363 [Bacteroidota bacterium]|jgi:glycosyltransferase involved in cell wall biosynthesis